MPYILRVLRTCMICGLIPAISAQAIAGGLVVSNGSPRAIGRAGTGTVGDDGGGALLVNPAAMARREGARGQLGLAFTDDEIAWRGRSNAPIARNQSPSDLAPTGSVMASLGSWIVGLGVMTASVSQRALRPPSDLPPEDLGVDFDFRYTGITGGIQRNTLVLGVARRLGDTVAVGLSLGASRVSVSESRRVWAGFAGRDPIGDPDLDVEVVLDGVDKLVLGAVAGILIAPAEEPIELGASIAWTDRVAVAADANAFTAGTPRAPRIGRTAPSATIELEQPLAIRAGARYLGERFVVELGGDLWLAPTSAARASWSIAGLRVIDQSSFTTELFALPSRISLRTHGAVRGALDAELIAGFLWATAGYAYTVGAVEGGRQSPTFGDLGGHTLAAGFEATAGGFTFMLGWSRTWSVARRLDSQLSLDNPFNAGDASVPRATYDGSIDQIGLLLDVELDAPE